MGAVWGFMGCVGCREHYRTVGGCRVCMGLCGLYGDSRVLYRTVGGVGGCSGL